MNKVREKSLRDILEELVTNQYEEISWIKAHPAGYKKIKKEINGVLQIISSHYKSLIPKKKGKYNELIMESTMDFRKGYDQAIEIITERMNDG